MGKDGNNMITMKQVKELLDFTSIEWKGFFTEEEKQENLHQLMYEINELKHGNAMGCDDSLNYFCSLLLEEIYNQSIEKVFTYKEVEKIFKDYKVFIIDGGLKFSILQAF